jgi:hypothetical protein
MATLEKLYFSKEAQEKTLRDSLMTLNDYLEIFNRQVISKLANYKEVNKELCATEFLPAINDALLTFCTSYFDSVRDEAGRALLYIGKNFAKFDMPIPRESI